MRRRDQHGSSSVIFLLSWSMILLTVAFAADFGRIFFLREQLRTAKDAAALAGALQLDYKVRLVFAREKKVSEFVCTPEQVQEILDEEGSPDVCWVEKWVQAPDLVFEGWEDEAWPEVGSSWPQLCNGLDYRCTPAYKGPPMCWIEPEDSWDAAAAIARSAFERNQVWGDQATVRGLHVAGFKANFVNGDPSKPRTYEVTVDGQLEMKMYLLAALGKKTLFVRTDPPRPAKAELVRRGDYLTMVLAGNSLTSPCDSK